MSKKEENRRHELTPELLDYWDKLYGVIHNKDSEIYKFTYSNGNINKRLMIDKKVKHEK